MKNKIDDFRNYIEPEDALKEALRIAEKDDLVVVTGSTYLVGELRKFWLNEEIIL
jgi:folylpolyglutamate synthase/dihydropteroate synthase